MESTYRSRVPPASVRPRTATRPSALAYNEKKYQAFHSGRRALRTALVMPFSSVIMSPPRSTGDDIKDQRMASAPWEANMASGSG